MKERIMLTRTEYLRLRTTFIDHNLDVGWMDELLTDFVYLDMMSIPDEFYIDIQNIITYVKDKSVSKLLRMEMDDIFGDLGYLPFKVGDNLYCKEDFYMEGVRDNGGKPIYTRGKVYKCDNAGCITDNKGNDCHGMNFLGVSRYFDVIPDGDIDKYLWKMGDPYLVRIDNNWLLGWSTSDYRKFVLEEKKQTPEGVVTRMKGDFIKLDMPSGEIQDLARKTNVR